MKILLVLLVTLVTAAHAQQPVDATLRNSAGDPAAGDPAAGIPAHLRRIERGPGSSALGAVYFYGDQRLRSPFSLEIPFHELGDNEVDRRYRSFRVFNSVGQVVALAPLAYLLLRNRNQTGRGREYWYVFGGSVAASVVCTIGGNIQVGKAVRRYNQVLLENRLGVSVAPLPTGRAAVGLGWTGRLGVTSRAAREGRVR